MLADIEHRLDVVRRLEREERKLESYAYGSIGNTALLDRTIVHLVPARSMVCRLTIDYAVMMGGEMVDLLDQR